MYIVVALVYLVATNYIEQMIALAMLVLALFALAPQGKPSEAKVSLINTPQGKPSEAKVSLSIKPNKKTEADKLILSAPIIS